MLWHRVISAALLVMIVGGCGFRPLYGRDGGQSVAGELSLIQIAPINDRLGQQLRNNLLDALAPRGPGPGGSRYLLQVTLTEGISSLAVKKSAFATRANLQLSAQYSLQGIDGKTNLFSSTSRSVSSFNILGSEFATVMAERSARARALKGLGEEIRTQLAVFLRTETGPEDGSRPAGSGAARR